MKVGTKSLLIGVHQILWHPITVFLAWHDLYGWPNWKECICILIHDWGYWGMKNMDGGPTWIGSKYDYEEGIFHPILGSMIASAWLDEADSGDYRDMCLYHSRAMAKRYGATPSKLCWADKLSIYYDPWWFYLPRAILSGEIKEYRKRADDFGELTKERSHYDWYQWSRTRMIRKALNRETTPPYEGH